MVDSYRWFEHAISALESALGLSVTIIDNQGVFHTPTGQAIFPSRRQSHKKIPACDCGFSPRCVDFCRHRMNKECAGKQEAFCKTCWKGLKEIVTPLRRGNRHWGMLYLGAWRGGAIPRKAELPPEFAKTFMSLPPWRDNFMEELAPLMEAFASGLLQRLEELRALERPPPARGDLILDYIGARAADPKASLQDLAGKMNLSPSRVSHLLRECFGTGFAALVHRERINRAKTLLISTDDKLAAIAAATGFCDEYHLSKVFKKQAGTAPGKFRKTQRPGKK